VFSSPVTGATPIKILNLNTWLLRVPLAGDLARDIEARANMIPDKAAATGADVICLTEVWDAELRRQIIRDLGKRGYTYTAYRKGSPAEGELTRIENSLTASVDESLEEKLPTWFKARRSTPSGLLPDFYGFLNVGLNLMRRGLFRAVAVAANWTQHRMGDGLLLLSRWPVDSSVRSLTFSRFTRWDEAMVAKGAILARIKLPVLGWVDTYVTHLGATTYEPNLGDFRSLEIKTQYHQLEELIQWIRETRRSSAFILAGDFNQHWQQIRKGRYMDRLAAGYSRLVGQNNEGMGLIDTYLAVHSAREIVFTSDIQNNPYSHNPLDTALATQPSVVDDYIFVSRHPLFRPVRSEVVFKEQLAPASFHSAKIPPARLSDHYGVLTTLDAGLN
jgi:endonuclease/exonuclease/phosphatase family metal-dependent hydrolase